MPRIDGLQVEYETKPYFTAVWQWDDSGSAYVDHTADAQKDSTNFDFISDANDYWYFGHSSKFDMAMFLINTAGNYGDLTWELSDGGSWAEFVPIEEYDFLDTGVERFTHMADWTAMQFSDSDPHSATPPDTEYRYWVRVSASSVSTTASINKILINPTCRYTTPTDVRDLLQLSDDFSSITTPTREQVQHFIRKAEDRIDFDSHKSWRYRYISNEEHQFNRYGIRLLHFPVVELVKLEIWNGNSYESYDINRNNEVFSVDSTGMVYFSRFFILPARLAVSGAFWRWGYGEFTYPVRVSYIYGRDLDTDYQAGLVKEITTKLAAIDVLETTDYTVLTSSGVEHVSIDDKIRTYREETAEQLELLKSWLVI